MKKPIVGMPSSLRILASVPAEKIWGLTFNVKAVNVAWQQNPNHLWNHHHNNLEHQMCQRMLATKLWKRLWFQDVMVLMLICDENFNIASLFCLLAPSNHFSWKRNWGQNTTSLPHSPKNLRWVVFSDQLQFRKQIVLLWFHIYHFGIFYDKCKHRNEQKMSKAINYVQK